MARAVDKTQDAAAVVKLVDQLQKTIIVYQVCPKGCQVWAALTRMVTGVSTAIDPQSSHATDSMFLRTVSVLELTGRLLIQDFIRCISETHTGGKG